jgi:cysteinyl-tRNA synthetase
MSNEKMAKSQGNILKIKDFKGKIMWTSFKVSFD